MPQQYDFYKAEYIWVDGTKPVHKLRSKTKIVPTGQEPPIWGFDGSSTQQATGDRSDCVLKPVFVCDDPIRGGDNVLVLCEVLLPDMTPHPSNTRSKLLPIVEKLVWQPAPFQSPFTGFGSSRAETKLPDSVWKSSAVR